MGAFWDAWNKQGEANRAESLGALQQASAVQGILAQQRQGQMQEMALRRQEAMRGILSGPEPLAAKMEKLTQFGEEGVKVAGALAQLQSHQQDAAKKARIEGFWQNEAPKFTTPAQPEQFVGNAPQGGVEGPPLPAQAGILAARPATTDLEGMLSRGAQIGAVNPETLVNHRAQQQERAAARQDRMTALQMQIEERAQRGQDAADLRRELQANQIQARRDMAGIAGALRQPRNLQLTETSSGQAIVNPDGTLTPLIDPNTGKQAQGRANLSFDKGTQARAMELRKTFDSNPEIKRLNSIQSTVEPVGNYIANIGRTGMNPTADLAVVNAFLAATHPKGDQIGVRDRAEIAKLGNLGDRFGNAIEGFLSGKNLPDKVRNDMWLEISARYKTLAKQKENLRADVVKRARNMNVPEEYIFPD